MKQLLLYAAIAIAVAASWLSMASDKRETEVKMACEQALGGPPGRAGGSVPPPVAAGAAASPLVQVNEEQRTCRPRTPDQ
jgi:hypothetical protein